MKTAELSTYSAAYALLRELRQTGDREQEAVAALSDLSYPTPMTEAARQGFLQALASARFGNLRAQVLSREFLGQAAALKVPLTDAERNERVADIRRLYGACAATPVYPG